MNIIFHDELESTQDEAIKLIKAQKYVEGTFIVARKQSKGYGRSGNRWFSSLGCLTFSYASIRGQSYLNILFNLQRTLEFFDVKSKIKWPNDLLINNRKISGVLIDKYNNFDVLGIGINLYGEIHYGTIENICKKRIKPESFIKEYVKVFNVTKDIDINIPDLWFQGKVCRVIEVHDEYLLIESCDKKIIRIEAAEYSYNIEKNSLVAKEIF